MKKFLLLIAMLGVVAFGTMANKCEYNPTYTEPQNQSAPADQNKPADEAK